MVMPRQMPSLGRPSQAVAPRQRREPHLPLVVAAIPVRGPVASPTGQPSRLAQR